MTALHARTPIRVLAPDVAARIAAGEVVERPASAAKELIENALDAAASRIEIEVEGGGIDLLCVADDGHGIPAEELSLAFQRFATSKLRDDQDLGRISSMGFRGEALPSIASVARVTCLSRIEASDLAARLSISYGEMGQLAPAARSRGTTIRVEDLFLQTPARRKFLRGRAAETNAITQMVQQLALARPDVAFQLSVDGKVIFVSEGDGDLGRIAARVLGLADVSLLLPVSGDDRNLDLSVSGYLGDASAHRPTRGGMSFFINGRWVQSRQLSFAVEEACRTWTPTSRFPIAVLHLSMPPSDVDVNVHPRKTEVRFLRERAVFTIVQRAVRQAVLEAQEAGAAHALTHEGETSGRVLRVLGQAAQTYIIAEGEHGLYLVDQHAAHERVVLEQLLVGAQHNGYQLLMEPVVVSLPMTASETIDQTIAALADLGYQSEPFGPDALLIRSVPATLLDRQPLRVLADTLEELTVSPQASDLRHLVAVRLACHSAVRAGDTLDPAEMEALVQQLGEAEICGACAHGRPTAILMSHDDLERQFGRR